MAGPVHYRMATGADALCVGVLGMQVFLDTYAHGGIRPSLAREVLQDHAVEAVGRRIAEADRSILLAEVDGHLVGFVDLLMGSAHALVPSRRPAEIVRLYVHPRFAGRGVGTDLLESAHELARAKGASDLWLTCWAENARAIGFYQRCGYRNRGSGRYTFERDEYAIVIFSRPAQAGTAGGSRSQTIDG